MTPWCAKCLLNALSKGQTREKLAFYLGGTDKNANTMYAGEHYGYVKRSVTIIEGKAVCMEHIL